MRAKSPDDSIAAALERADADLVRDPRDCLDTLCVANLGTWTHMQIPRRPVPSQQSLVLETSYMGPGFLPFQTDPPVIRHNPIGRMLTALLMRLAPVDPSLGAIQQVGLFGSAVGSVRKWHPEDLVGVPKEALRPIS